MLKVFEAFSGIGTQRMALRNLGIQHEVVGISEIDKAAIKAYGIIHGDCPNFGDISKINPRELPDFDLFTYSFPCQDLSTAGKKRGLVKGQTRSGLLYECEKIIKIKRPKYLLLENVKNLVGKKFKPAFEEWLVCLEKMGYTNHWKVLNAKDYGVPQNRERVFVVSILGESNEFSFPKTSNLVDLSEFLHLNKKKDDECFFVHPLVKKSSRYYFERDLSKIKNTDKGIFACTCTSGWQDHKVGTKYTPTLRANNHHTCILDGNVIRRITPLEAFLLMGISSEDFSKLNGILSESQLFKLAGNAIVVNVLQAIFEKMFLEEDINEL